MTYLVDHLRRALQRLSALIERNTGVTTSQLAVLCALREAPLNQTELTAATGIDRSTMADIVRRLMKRGWVSRRRNREDARANICALTAEGRAVAEQADLALRQIDADLEKLDGKRGVTCAMLDRIAAAPQPEKKG